MTPTMRRIATAESRQDLGKMKYPATSAMKPSAHAAAPIPRITIGCTKLTCGGGGTMSIVIPGTTTDSHSAVAVHGRQFRLRRTVPGRA